MNENVAEQNIEIRVISFKEAETVPNFLNCIKEYEQLCNLPNIKGKATLDRYKALEDAGKIALILLTVNQECAGFITVMFQEYEHISAQVASFESVYVTPSQRRQGKANMLFDYAFKFAKANGAVGALLGAPVNSRLEKVYDRKFLAVNKVYWHEL